MLKALVAQLWLTFCDSMDCSLPRSCVPVILQARILGWVAIPFSGVSSQPRDQTGVSCIAGRFFTLWATRETLLTMRGALNRKKKKKKKKRLTWLRPDLKQILLQGAIQGTISHLPEVFLIHWTRTLCRYQCLHIFLISTCLSLTCWPQVT